MPCRCRSSKMTPKCSGHGFPPLSDILANGARFSRAQHDNKHCASIIDHGPRPLAQPPEAASTIKSLAYILALQDSSPEAGSKPLALGLLYGPCHCKAPHAAAAGHHTLALCFVENWQPFDLWKTNARHLWRLWIVRSMCALKSKI